MSRHLLSVQGTLIDLNYIYAITSIKGNDCWTYHLDRIDEQFKSKLQLTHSGFVFIIKMYNQENLVVAIDGDEEFGDANWWLNKEEYTANLKKLEDSITQLRNTLIIHWQMSPKPIRNLEFNIKY